MSRAGPFGGLRVFYAVQLLVGEVYVKIRVERSSLWLCRGKWAEIGAL